MFTNLFEFVEHLLSFGLVEVTEDKVLKIMQKMKQKKSSGTDGLSQEQMIHGSSALVKPLTKIINESIRTGIFPESWKEAVVTPILKKGSAHDKTNYRPVIPM